MDTPELTSSEQTAVGEFLNQINSQRAKHAAPPISPVTAIKFLMARKFEVKRAVELFFNYGITRYKEGIIDIQPQNDPVNSELLSEKFTILPCRDVCGASVALFTARLHEPERTSHQVVLKAIVYQLDRILESVETQRNGIIFIYDMTNSSYHNFDYDLCVKMLSLLKGAYPARLKKVLIVSSPLWFRAPFAVLRLFVREKLRDRVEPVKMQDLCRHISNDILPTHLGGNLTVNHREWLDRCFNMSHPPHDKPRAKVSMSEVVNNFTHAQMVEDGTQFGVIDNTELESNHRIKPENLLCNQEPGDNNDSTLYTLQHASYKLVPETPVDLNKEEIKSGSFESGESFLALSEPPQPPTMLETQVNGQSEIVAIPRRQSSLSVPETPDPYDIPPYNHSPGARMSQDNGELLRQMAIVSNGSIHGPLSLGNDMTPDELVDYLLKHSRNHFVIEYNQIKMEDCTATFNICRNPKNQQKNRYNDVQCFDHSRVKLQVDHESNSPSDYIHASYVDGYCQPKAFIATQGPKQNTCIDFWKMIWEQKVLIVVMTTRVVEKQRLKCFQYWPNDPGTSTMFNPFQITNIHVEWCQDYRLSTLELKNTSTNESREIAHYQFTSWPDMGVPREAKAMLSFLDQVRHHQTLTMQALGSQSWAGNSFGPPIVVHCSAGIGRTGTFCTLDICIKRLQMVGTIDIKETVRKIRQQRAYSLQTADQYYFCHMALAEYCHDKGFIKNKELAEKLLNGDVESDSDSDF